MDKLPWEVFWKQHNQEINFYSILQARASESNSKAAHLRTDDSISDSNILIYLMNLKN